VAHSGPAHLLSSSSPSWTRSSSVAAQTPPDVTTSPSSAMINTADPWARISPPTAVPLSPSLYFSSPRRNRACPPWPPGRAAVPSRPELHRRAPKLRLAFLASLTEGIEPELPESPTPSPFSPQQPELAVVRFAASGDPCPCEPGGRPQGEPPLVSPCFPSPGAPPPPSVAGRPAPRARA
jgi:hypothetical protein